MSTSAGNKVTVEAEYNALITAIPNEFPASASFEILGQTFTRDAFLAKLKTVLDVSAISVTTKLAWRAAVSDARQVTAEVNPLRVAFRGILAMKYGKDSPKLLEFGYKPNKAPKKTAAAKTVGAAKAKATRTLRHTMGTVQKKTVKGTVVLTAPELEAVVATGANAGRVSGANPAPANGGNPQAVPANPPPVRAAGSNGG